MSNKRDLYEIIGSEEIEIERVNDGGNKKNN